MTTGFVDFHCHLDLYPDHTAVFAECEDHGIHTLAVTTTPKAWPRNHDLTTNARFVRPALGLHPQLVAERAQELGLWETYLSEAHYVGEVGLDAGPRFFRSIDLQKQVFEKILAKCAQSGGKILTVHSVRATTQVLNMIEKHLPPDRGRVVLHWFTGSIAETRRAIDLGCYFSLNYQMLGNERHRNMVVTLPLDRIITETDGPFCQYRGKPARPIDIPVAVDLLAQIVQLEPRRMAELILSNLNRLESFG